MMAHKFGRDVRQVLSWSAVKFYGILDALKNMSDEEAAAMPKPDGSHKGVVS